MSDLIFTTEYARAKASGRSKAFTKVYQDALMRNKSQEEALRTASEAIDVAPQDEFPPGAKAAYRLEYRRAQKEGVDEPTARHRAMMAAVEVVRRREG
jgi:hypothetical protein